MGPKDTPYLFTTDRHNRYIHDGNIDLTLLCHPVLFYLIRLGREGVSLEHWVRRHAHKSIEIDGCGRFAPEVVQHYYRKYLLLRENGYFDRSERKGRFVTHISPDLVKAQLSSLSQVVFEATDRCNLKCSYCGYGKFYGDYDRRQNRKLDPNAARRLIDYLAGFWNSSSGRSHHARINVGFYGGEPLLNFPFIEQMVEHIGNLEVPGRHFSFSITTNALLLKKYMDYLRSHDFYLLVSLDGNARNNSYRVFPDGRESHQRVCENVKALQSRYPEYFREKVRFNAVFHNRSDLTEIDRFFKENFGMMPKLNELNTNGIRSSCTDEFWNTFSDTTESFSRIDKPMAYIKDFSANLPPIEAASKFIHSHNDFCFRDYNEMVVARKNRKRYPTGTCLPFSARLFMTVNNKLIACEKIGHQYSFGRVTDRGVELNFDRIAANYSECLGRVASVCRRCHRSDSCGVCIFYKNIDQQRPKCPSFMSARDFEAHLASYVNYLEHYPRLYSTVLEDFYYE